jgi:hypothetical protein
MAQKVLVVSLSSAVHLSTAVLLEIAVRSITSPDIASVGVFST